MRIHYSQFASTGLSGKSVCGAAVKPNYSNLTSDSDKVRCPACRKLMRRLPSSGGDK